MRYLLNNYGKDCRYGTAMQFAGVHSKKLHSSKMSPTVECLPSWLHSLMQLELHWIIVRFYISGDVGCKNIPIPRWELLSRYPFKQHIVRLGVDEMYSTTEWKSGESQTDLASIWYLFRTFSIKRMLVNWMDLITTDALFLINFISVRPFLLLGYLKLSGR